jgi:DNA-binding GntR family transcriptional regulator
MGTRTERLVETLRLDIVMAVFPPGSRLREEALAEQYGVSRTPVREALRILARESLLTYTPRVGYTVASMTVEEMDDLYAVRIAIEEQVAARLISAGQESVLHNLLSYWGDMPQSVAGGDVNLVFEDELFHETLAHACGSTVLPEMLQTINRRMHVVRIRDFVNADRVRLTFQQHSSILRSLLAGDSRLAAAMLRAHIWESHAYVRARFIEDQRGSQ